MDGWESRRRRTEGHDWCVIATESKAQGKINDVVGIEVDTAYFTGNQTPKISIEVANCYVEGEDVEEEEWMYTWMPGAVKRLLKGGGTQGTGQSPAHINKAKKACEKFEWNEILPVTELKPGYEESRMHYFMLDEERREMAKGFTHVRVNYFPDGGVARLRLWGSAESDLTSNVSIRESDGDENVIPSSLPYHHPELSLSTNGGVGLSCSNKHYGVPENLIRPTYGKDMSDGWETARHPDRPPVLIKNPVTNLIDNPLMDWAVLKLGMGGAVDGEGVSRIIIDTKHFKGNFPESVMVEGCNANCIQASDEDVCAATPEESISKIQWFPLLTRTKMGPDSEHVFHKEKGELMNSNCAVTHIRVSIYPDGGISRVRVYGQAAQG
jgi:allantoicase